MGAHSGRWGKVTLPRRQKIPAKVDSKYFTGVTPLWEPPDKPAIPEKYHDAVYALAEWAGPDWSVNERTSFFLIRMVVIESCEAWSQYDWETDELSINDRRLNEKKRPKLAKAAEKLSDSLASPSFQDLKIGYLRHLLAQIGAKPPFGFTNDDAIAAVENSFQTLAKSASIIDRAYARYGPIEYEILPTRFPQKEVAIALSLADRITYLRKDGESAGSLWTPHPPNLSRNLPWRAIAYFASANADENNMLDETSVQTQVQSLARSVSQVYWA